MGRIPGSLRNQGQIQSVPTSQTLRQSPVSGAVLRTLGDLHSSLANHELNEGQNSIIEEAPTIVEDEYTITVESEEGNPIVFSRTISIPQLNRNRDISGTYLTAATATATADNNIQLNMNRDISGTYLTAATTATTAQTRTNNEITTLLSAILGMNNTINTSPHYTHTNTNLNNIFNTAFMNPVIIRPTADILQRATLTYVLEDNETDSACAICQDNIEIGEQVLEIRHCHHRFHSGCIGPWFQRDVHCPVCRFDIRQVSGLQG